MKIGVILLIFFVVAHLYGCGMLRSISSGIAGRYMAGIEETRGSGQEQVFNYDIDECFDKVLAILDTAAIDATILKIDRRNYKILVLVSRPMMDDVDDSIFYANSVDVGIFFTQDSQDKTKVEIVSLSSYFAEHTADKIFPEL